jgi:hypothetical protein
MVVKMGGLIDTLESTMYTCCNRHNMCTGCRFITGCLGIWDKASEQSVIKPLTPEQLAGYIDEFSELWESEGEIARA